MWRTNRTTFWVLKKGGILWGTSNTMSMTM